MAESLKIDDFLELAESHSVVDVRTPAEFEQGRIPGAHNVPLFSNEERVVIGTAYKQQSREEAMLEGLDLVGPRMRGIVEQIQPLVKDNRILIHCWRGGMRSGSVAWLMGFFGVQVTTLKGGYKAFRNYALDALELPLNVRILGGKTGSRKTDILEELKKRGEQVIDLEGIAGHRGSAFGSFGLEEQKSQEMFENILGRAIRKLDPERPVWLEDESRKIGRRVLPASLWDKMRDAEVYHLDVPQELRAEHLIDLYGHFDGDLLANAVENIKKRLGGLAARDALEHLKENRLIEACKILLSYYDRAYGFGLSQREPAKVHQLPTENVDPSLNADLLLENLQQI